MSNRQLNRFSTAQKIQSFYLNKKIKNGDLVLKSDAKETYTAMLKHFEKVHYSIFTPENQLEDMAYKTESELRIIIKRQTDLVMLELAYDEQPFQESELVRKLFQDEIKKNIELDFACQGKKPATAYVNEYKSKIIDLLKTDYDTVKVCLDEIIDTCQFKLVIIFLTVCSDIQGLPKRDRKEENEKKQKFNRDKERMIKDRKKYRLPYEDVLSLEYDNKEQFGSCNYQTSLKHYKEMLSTNLVGKCGTTKKRAANISNILTYL